MNTENQIETDSGKAPSFEAWMRVVDRSCEMIAGCSVYDLPDYCFRDAYDRGSAPKSVARAAIRNARD